MLFPGLNVTQFNAGFFLKLLYRISSIQKQLDKTFVQEFKTWQNTAYLIIVYLENPLSYVCCTMHTIYDILLQATSKMQLSLQFTHWYLQRICQEKTGPETGKAWDPDSRNTRNSNLLTTKSTKGGRKQLCCLAGRALQFLLSTMNVKRKSKGGVSRMTS